MNFSHALTGSRLKMPLIYPIALIAIAIGAFALGSEAASGSTGGVSAGGGGSSSKSEGGNKYAQIWDEFPAAQKRWAHTTSECESGGDPNAIGGGGAYRGAFQFLRSSWKSSPKSPGGDPIDYDYRTQAVVAVLLKKQMGTSPWPVCG